MGASISVNLTQKSINETARTATVGVVITVTSTAGTHNHFNTADRGAVLYVSIDGSSYEYVTPFGSEETGTFTSTIFSSDITVPYNSDGTRTVFVSATLATGTTGGGSPSHSASITLTPISSSSGSEGGDSGGDNGGEEWVDPNLPTNPEMPPLGSSNVTIIGQDELTTIDGAKTWDFSSTKTARVYYRDSGITSTHWVVFIKFSTPQNSELAKSIDVKLSVADCYDDNDITVNAVLTKSLVNYKNYYGAEGSVYDPDQICSGTVNLKKYSLCTLNIPVNNLSSNTEYYLALWIPCFSENSSRYCDLYPSPYHSINLNATSGDDYVTSKVTFDVGEYTSISVLLYSFTSGVYEEWKTLTPGHYEYDLQIPSDSLNNANMVVVFFADDGYTLGDCSFNGDTTIVNYSNGASIYSSASGGDSGGSSGDTVHTYIGKGVFYIDNGTDFEAYWLFIDDGESWVPVGSSYQSETGDFTLRDNSATVSCGFVPDYVIIDAGTTYDEQNNIVRNTCMAPINKDGTMSRAMCAGVQTRLLAFSIGLDSETQPGFKITGKGYLWDWSEASATGTFGYTAVKYT